MGAFDGGQTHEAFQNQDQDRAQVKNSSSMDCFFKTYHNYLTIECLYLIKYVLQTRLFQNYKLFYEREDTFNSCDR